MCPWGRPAAGANRLILLELQRLSFRQRLDVLRGEPKDADRTGDILNRLLAEISEGDPQLVSDLIVRRAGDAKATGLAQSFQAGSDIDAIPEDVAVIYDDIAYIDADAKNDALVLANTRIATEHAALNRNRALHRIDDAAKLDQRPVACRLDDTPMMSGDRGVDQLAAVGFQRRQRAHFIDAHQPAVADDIRSENGRKPALSWLSFHVRLPPASYSVGRRDYLPLAFERQSISSGQSRMKLLRLCPQNAIGRFSVVLPMCKGSTSSTVGRSHEIGSGSRFDR